jgi:hypothetical protein
MVPRMSPLRLVVCLSCLAACGPRASAPAPTVVPEAEAAPAPTCARGVYVVDDKPQEVQAEDVAACKAQLDAAISDASASRKQAIATLDEQIAALDTRIQAARDARDQFLDQQQVLRSVRLDDVVAMYKERVARAKKPAKRDVDELERLEKLVPQVQQLDAAIVAVEDERSKLVERRGDLMLARPAAVLERCSACPPR